jgi:hypothetical protein
MQPSAEYQVLSGTHRSARRCKTLQDAARRFKTLQDAAKRGRTQFFVLGRRVSDADGR